MQRRLAGQQRAIRLLIVLLIIVTLASIVFNLTMAASWRAGTTEPSPDEASRQMDPSPANSSARGLSGAESVADDQAETVEGAD
jgi:hypothetical protein